MTERTTKTLPYKFGPVPNWAFEYVRDRKISQDDGWLLACLYRLARTETLISGGETRVNLATLLEYVDSRKFRRRAERQRAHDALRKKIERAQKRGLFTYRVTGNPTTGYRYLFQLPQAAPEVSALRPTTNGNPHPTSQAAPSESAPDVAAEAKPNASDHQRAKELPSRPRSDSSCPTSRTERNPDHNAKNATRHDDSRPRAIDLRDDNKPSSRERSKEKSLSDLVPRSDDFVDDLIASTDRMLSLTDREATGDPETNRRSLVDSEIDQPASEQEFLTELVETFDAKIPDQPDTAPNEATSTRPANGVPQ